MQIEALVADLNDWTTATALVYGLSDVVLNKLWNVQKSAIRLITMSGKYQHISPAMANLHWLLIWQRIEY